MLNLSLLPFQLRPSNSILRILPPPKRLSGTTQSHLFAWPPVHLLDPYCASLLSSSRPFWELNSQHKQLGHTQDFAEMESKSEGDQSQRLEGTISPEARDGPLWISTSYRAFLQEVNGRPLLWPRGTALGARLHQRGLPGGRRPWVLSTALSSRHDGAVSRVGQVPGRHCACASGPLPHPWVSWSCTCGSSASDSTSWSLSLLIHKLG